MLLIQESHEFKKKKGKEEYVVKLEESKGRGNPGNYNPKI